MLEPSRYQFGAGGGGGAVRGGRVPRARRLGGEMVTF